MKASLNKDSPMVTLQPGGVGEVSERCFVAYGKFLEEVKPKKKAAVKKIAKKKVTKK